MFRSAFRRIGFAGAGLILIIWLSGGLARAGMEEESPAKRQEKAREFFKKGLEVEDPSEKESFYVKALELWPGHPEAHNNLGDVYENQGRYEEAIREYTLAATFAPNAPYPYFGLGDVYFKLGQYEWATVNYEKGLKIDPNDKASQENLKIARALNTKILFHFGLDQLTDRAMEQLKEVAAALSSQKLANAIFEIQGHTDSVGPENYNTRLSQRRADGVEKYLTEKGGIAPERLIAKGYGEDRPIASNETKEGGRMNRRVNFKKMNKTCSDHRVTHGREGTANGQRTE